MLTVIGMIESEWWGWAQERGEEFAGYRNTPLTLKTISWNDALLYSNSQSVHNCKMKPPDPTITRTAEEISNDEKIQQLIQEFGR
ncbi:MAG: hypothetical protein DRO67_00115 [Candidatus Asgardarchaeum californiense]|nr:MAG: hypothetical protein DRO67_00115 [Candidatus Asgardarchaeum californiense]